MSAVLSPEKIDTLREVFDVLGAERARLSEMSRKLPVFPGADALARQATDQTLILSKVERAILDQFGLSVRPEAVAPCVTAPAEDLPEPEF